MEEAAPPQQVEVRRGKLNEEDGGDIGRLLLPRVVIGPDENGTKKVIEYHFDNAGNKVKVTTTITVTRKRELARVRRLGRGVIERRLWPKFGDATEGAGSRFTFTMHSPDEIHLERPRTPGSKADERVGSKDDVVLLACIICGTKGDHWTAKCPRRYPALQTNPPQIRFRLSPRTLKKDPSQEAHPLSFMVDTSDRFRDSLKRMIDDGRCVRVTNLSEETYEDHLYDLACFFGIVLRVYVPVDMKTGLGRGFGFVQFAHRREAEAAIQRLNGHTYNDLVLQVEWAAPWLKGALPESPIRTRATDEYRVRVTNLSEDIHRDDLFELFGPFGKVTCARVAVDKKSGLRKGFGLVDFAQKHEAEHAIRVVNGHTYDNRVLGVGWEHQHQET